MCVCVLTFAFLCSGGGEQRGLLLLSLPGYPLFDPINTFVCCGIIWGFDPAERFWVDPPPPCRQASARSAALLVNNISIKVELSKTEFKGHTSYLQVRV